MLLYKSAPPTRIDNLSISERIFGISKSIVVVVGEYVFEVPCRLQGIHIFPQKQQWAGQSSFNV